MELHDWTIIWLVLIGAVIWWVVPPRVKGALILCVSLMLAAGLFSYGLANAYGTGTGVRGHPKTTQLAKADIPANYRTLYQRHGTRCRGLSWRVLAGVGKVESNHGRVAGSKPGGSSSAGAQGPMQFMPGTWPGYGRGDVHDPKNAIPAAAKYLCANGMPDVRVALAAYNAGPGNARHPSAQVRGYVDNVLAWAERYRTGRF